MLRNRRMAFAVASTLVLASAGGGIAVASSGEAPTGKPQPPASEVLAQAQPLNADVAAAFRAFREQGAEVSKTLPAGSRLAQVARSVKELPVGSPGQDLDLARAVEVSVKNASTRVWIAPAGAEVCTITEDPVDGSGTSCASLAQIKRGTGFGVLGPVPSGEYIVSGAVPDGAEGPTLTSAGARHEISVSSNVAAEAVKPTGTIAVGDGPTIDLAQLGAGRK